MNYPLLLEAELNHRRRRDPQYSRRRLALDLGISAASLCQIMNGKRSVTPATAQKIRTGCEIRYQEQERLLLECHDNQNRRLMQPFDTNIALDKFRILATWHHYAVLGVLPLLAPPHNVESIARHLELPETLVAKSLKELKQLEVVRFINGAYRQVGQPLFTSSDKGEEAIQSYHQGILFKAADAIERVPPSKREYFSWMLALEPDYLPEAKAAVRDFCAVFVKRFTRIGQGKARLYQLGLQLFPLDRDTD